MRLNITFANNWQGRCQDELLDYVAQCARRDQVLFFSEVESVPAHHPQGQSTEPCYITASDGGKVMVNQGNVLQQRFQDEFHCWFFGENRKTYVCRKTGTEHAGVEYGNFMMVHRSVKLIAYGHEFVYGQFRDGPPALGSVSPRLLHHVVVEIDRVRYLLAHMHGIWLANNTKGDSPERTLQSRNVLSALQEAHSIGSIDKGVLGGDFNLDLDTEALAILESGFGKVQFRNAIKTFNVTGGTRTLHYRNRDKDGHSQYADYALYTPNTEVHDLRFGGDHVSDHKFIHMSIS